jgi:hypothetical protein
VRAVVVERLEELSCRSAFLPDEQVQLERERDGRAARMAMVLTSERVPGTGPVRMSNGLTSVLFDALLTWMRS